MKVGIYDPYFDDLGGGEKYMAKIAECLSANNDVTIFWENKKDVDELLRRFSLDLSKVKFSKNIFTRDFGFFNRLKESRKYDVLIVLSDGSIPVVATKLFLHIQQPLLFVRLDLKSRLKIRRVRKFFCNSNFTKKYIDKTFSAQGEVLYPPVEINKKSVKKENIILHVGRFRVRDVVTKSGGSILGVGDYKKQGEMIEAFRGMVKKGLKNWKFILAVSIKEEDRELFEKLRVSAKGLPIEFLINQPNNKLWDTYSRAKIYWHASGFGEDLEKHPEYAEHFGISTVEAMGAGAVPVVINAGGQKEIVEDGENGFLWSTLSELEEKTKMLIENESMLKKMSEAAEKRADFFAGDRFCKEVINIIQ